MNSEAFSAFTGKNLDYESRWRDFDPKNYPSIADSMPEELIPFSGMREFATLSQEQKKQLYLGMIRLNAEAITLLEVPLIVAARKIVRRPDTSPAKKAALQKLFREEFLHVKAFRRVMREDPGFGFPEKSVMLKRNAFVKKKLVQIASWTPAALSLPAVKLEIYSIVYARTLKKIYGSWDANAWCKVHELHLLDEAHHVPLQFDVHDGELDGAGILDRIKTVLGIFAFVILLQSLLITGSSRIVAEVFPDENRWQRFQRGLRLARWSVREFPPYKATILQMRTTFLRAKPRYRRLFSFMHW